jgi:hypothetical protein
MDLTLSINFNAPQLRLGRDMNETLEHTLLSLHGVASLAESPARLSTSHGGDLPELQAHSRPLEIVRPGLERWLFTSAFRDAIEHVAAFFEAIREADALLSLSGTSSFTHDQFVEAVVAPAATFDRRFFPQKIEYLRQKDLMPPVFDPHLLSINNARNCLVHRRGVVGAQDVDGAGAMRVSWRRPTIFSRSPGGATRPVRIGDTVEAGTELLSEVVPVEKVFSIGEPVHFGGEDIMGIWWTVLQFGARTTQLLFDKARAAGFVFGDAAG